MNTVLLGSHMSTAGGLHTAFERGTRVSCSTMQIFVKNNNQWRGKAQTQADVDRFMAARSASAITPVVAHAAYLINLCAADSEVLSKSRAAYEDELRRAEPLELLGVIVHPGSHVGAGDDEGIRKIAESLNIIHANTPRFATKSILETTAGQGTAIGHRFEQIRAIIDQVDDKERIGVCMDSCHLFAAGYPIDTEEGWNRTMQEFDEIVGFHRLMSFHVNDSKKERGSHVDRHDHIGKGVMGLTPFRMLMNDPRLERIPKILETEKSEDMHEDVENMKTLVSLIATV